MKSGTRRLVSAAGLLVGLLSVACKQDAGPVSQVDPVAIYGEVCARCHGDDGRGNPAVAQALPVRDLTSPEVKQQSTESLERVIMAGRNQMPAFGEMLTPRKIQALVGHIRRLGEK